MNKEQVVFKSVTESKAFVTAADSKILCLEG